MRVPAPLRRPALPLFALLLATLAAAPAAAQSDGRIRYDVAADGNEARYRVREQLARIDFPSDAVGATSNVTGQLVVDAGGRVVKDASKFTIDVSTLATDSDRRDNYVRRRTLVTDTFPTVVFVPSELQGLKFPLTNGEHTFRMVGDLTVKGVTRPTTWDVAARVVDGVVTGIAKTTFTFDQFQMTKPRVGSVLSVADDIRLEYEFRLVPAH